MNSKRILIMLLAVMMCISMLASFAFASNAATVLPDGAILVNPNWTDADATPAAYTFGDKEYKLSFGVNAFGTFQEALDAAPIDGTVLLTPGAYSGTITIKKSVTVLGSKYGINPNTKGAAETDDWTLTAGRGSDEAQITGTVFCGVDESNVYADAKKITFDGVMQTGAGQFRSNNGNVGACELTYKNIYLKNSTSTVENFYFAPYYPTSGPNSYRRYITIENLRVEKQTTKSVMLLCYETADFSGIYMDSACTMQLLGAAGTTDGAVYSDDEASLHIHDCMFRAAVQRLMYIDYNPATSIASKKLNANIGQRKQVNNVMERCVFVNCAGSSTSNKWVVAFRVETKNVNFAFRNNTFYQTKKVSVSGFYPLGGYAGKSDTYGKQVEIKNNKFIGFDGDVSFSNVSDTVDLNGNYSETLDGEVVSIRSSITNKDISWWWMDRDMTVRSDTMGQDIPLSRVLNPESDVKFFGRTYEVNGVTYFNWSNAGFEFKFKGTSAYAAILSNAPGGTGTAYLSIYIDGEFSKYVKLSSAKNFVTLAEKLSDGAHTVRVVKRTNTRSSTAGLETLWLGEGGTKLIPNAQAGRKMEFVGDSITVGYGTLGKSGESWSTETEDGTITYAALTAKYFSAENNTIAVSGRGIVKNTDGDTDNMAPEMYEYTDWNNRVDWDHTQYVPDVIVINYGTNDNSGNGTYITDDVFAAGCKEFIKQVRKDNPTSKIIYAYGFMGDRFNSAITNLVKELNDEGDEDVYYLHLTPVTSAEKTVNGHPTAAANADRANALIAKVAEVTGWTAESAHDFEQETVIPATCKRDGLSKQVCKICGLAEQVVVPKGEHIWDNGVVTTAPTCVAKGVKTYTCTVCKTETKTEDIDPTGIHTYDKGVVTTEPTCVAKGVKTFTCTVCGDTKTEDVNPTGIHTYDEGVITTEPTEKAEGVKTFTCTVCGDTKTESVPKLAPKRDAAKEFKDVSTKDWFYKNGALNYALNAGLFGGTTATTFEPNTNMTRGMFVTVLGRLAGVSSKGAVTKFTDVKKSAYYSGYVKWASDKGIVSGTSATKFEPEANVNREQICKMMVEYCNAMGIHLVASKTEIKFADAAKISKWAKTYVKTCQMAGLVNGKENNKFDPQGNATRAEVATILYNFNQNYGEK